MSASNWPTKEAASLARAAEAAGAVVRRTKRGHMRVAGPGGIAFVCTKLGGKGGETLTSTLATIARETGLVLKLGRRPA